MKTKIKESFFKSNGLSIVFVVITVLALSGQAITGWHEYNDFLSDHDKPEVSIWAYFSSGHFIQATFENWESEFFQMGLFVWFTVFLKQKGSSESKKFDGTDAVDKEPKNHKDAPWAVKKGGIILSIYKHSLTIALFLLFFISFILHWYGSNKDFNEIQTIEGKDTESMLTYLSNSRLWFESFQNWQSEFLSVFAIIFLSIYLREFGSPQSKPVDAPHSETGES